MGNYNKQGMVLALEEINKDNKNLNIIFEDSTSSPQNAINAFNNFKNIYNLPVVLTSASSIEGMSLAPVAQNNSTVLLAAGVAANNYRYSGDFVFRVKSSVYDEVDFLLDYIDRREDLKTIYLLYVQNDYGESIKESFIDIIDLKEIELLGLESFSTNEIDFRTHLLKVKEKEPDVLFISGWTNNHSLLIK